VNLLVDTGSSNIAIAGVNLTNVDNWFKPNQSSTLQCSDTIQNVRYEKGYWYGVNCQDYFHFADHQKQCKFENDRRNKNQALNSRQMSGKLLIGQMNLSLLLPSDSSSSSSTSLSSGLKMNNFKASNTYFTPIRKPWYYEIILTNLIVGNMSLVVNCKEVNENPALAELASKTSFWHGKRAYCLSVTTEDSKLQLYKSFPQIEFHLVSSINTSNQILSLTFSPQVSY
ncbi:unnamed protein product, partial [Trichobilharzia regenti]